MICNMATLPTLLSTFLVQYQQWVQPWKQQCHGMYQQPCQLHCEMSLFLSSICKLNLRKRISDCHPTVIGIKQHLLSKQAMLVEEVPNKQIVHVTIGNEPMGQSKPLSRNFTWLE